MATANSLAAVQILTIRVQLNAETQVSDVDRVNTLVY